MLRVVEFGIPGNHLGELRNPILTSEVPVRNGESIPLRSLVGSPLQSQKRKETVEPRIANLLIFFPGQAPFVETPGLCSLPT